MFDVFDTYDQLLDGSRRGDGEGLIPLPNVRQTLGGWARAVQEKKTVPRDYGKSRQDVHEHRQ